MALVTTIQIVGKKGKLTINASDLDMWRKQGYRLASEAEPAKTEASKEADTDTDVEEPSKNKVKVRSKTQR